MAPFVKSDTIWFNGAFVPWDAARVHVMAHGLHYGTGVFEGIRSYATDDGPAVFRLDEHLARLFASAALYELDPPNNTFPSLHVAFMLLTALGVWRAERRIGPYLLGVAALPAIAILTTKQHYVLDFIGGVALGLACHAVVFGGVTSPARSRLPAA